SLYSLQPPGMNLCRLLQLERDAVIEEWVRQLSRATSDRYRQRDLTELRETVARAYDGNFSVICNHDWQPIEEFIVFITRMRLERGFSLSEVQRAFGIFRVIMLRRLPLVFQGEELVNALLAVNHSVDVTINRFSEYFQSKHEEEMQGFLENLEGKVKERTEQLYNSEKRYRTLVEGIGDGYFVCREGRLIFANRALGRMLGRRPENLQGREFTELFVGGEEPAAMSEPEAFATEAVRADGRRFPVEIKLDRIQYDGRPALAGVCRDIVERMATARRELEHERLLVIGRVATVFAHEIRNSLSSIKVNVRVLQRRLDLGENDRRRMEIILRDIDKLDQLLQDTLLFSRPLEINPQLHDPGQLLAEARRRFAERLAAAGVEVELALSPGLPRIKVDRGSFEIVLDNLLANAIEAMSGVEAGKLRLSAAAAAVAGEAAAAALVFEVADNGCGLGAAEIGQIFQPFYTTRKNGIGLGLSNVARVVEEHGGHIEVASEPGRGTVFKVVLPCPRN
ncbi:MAG: PAS domain S-box protein, partial [Deltaproteobacteria bacterium]|nr:PAS domain S-box protein [Deltaproteobacteria bacterium]